MKFFKRSTHLAKTHGSSVSRPIKGEMRLTRKNASKVAGLVLATNVLTYALFAPGMFIKPKEQYTSDLYLMEKASVYVLETRTFEKKVRKVAKKLDIPPEWLMAVMFSESSFDASVVNRKGSGATGLIQFTPITAEELNTTVDKIRNLNHVDQLDYVYKYLNLVRKRYGDFKTLTDLYLGILYPKAISQDYCYSLYENPSTSYKRNSGLDENKDGRVTISDIDRRMQRIFPTAFAIQLGEEGEERS